MVSVLFSLSAKICHINHLSLHPLWVVSAHATPGLHLGIAPGGLWRSYGVSGIKSSLASCNIITLLFNVPFYPLCYLNAIYIFTYIKAYFYFQCIHLLLLIYWLFRIIHWIKYLWTFLLSLTNFVTPWLVTMFDIL